MEHKETRRLKDRHNYRSLKEIGPEHPSTGTWKESKWDDWGERGAFAKGPTNTGAASGEKGPYRLEISERAMKGGGTSKNAKIGHVGGVKKSWGERRWG